jgi:hypothetical protein
MRFSKLFFRVTLILVCASFLAVCASARSKTTIPSAVLVSEGSVFAIPLEVGAVEEQVAPIPTWTALRRKNADRAVTITSQKI